MTIPRHAIRFVGQVSQKLITEIGYVVKDLAPPHIEECKGIDKPTVDSMLKQLHVHVISNFLTTNC